MRVVVGAAVVRDGAVLAAQRSYPEAVAGRWELPGGGVESGEDDAAALRRECVEEMGLAVTVRERLGPEVALGRDRVLRVYRCVGDGEPSALEHAALRWVRADELDALDWLPADRDLLPALTAVLADSSRSAAGSRPRDR